ncbi:MAG: hypothetical protein RI996_226 [Candidatus Parcubacteria bacterium]|jgi:hypothetical protein
MTHVTDEAKALATRFLYGVVERVMEDSLDTATLVTVVQVLIDKNKQTENLLAFVAAGCPKVDYPQPTQPVKPIRKKRVVSVDTPYLKYVTSVMIPPTFGKITLAQSGNVFIGYLDTNLKKWGTNKPEAAADETGVSIYEVKQDGDFRTLFSGLTTDTDLLCLTQEQIVTFITKFSDLLRQEGFPTFFLFEVGGEVFVLYVLVYTSGLQCGVDRFDSNSVWHALYRSRAVVRQKVS